MDLSILEIKDKRIFKKKKKRRNIRKIIKKEKIRYFERKMVY